MVIKPVIGNNEYTVSPTTIDNTVVWVARFKDEVIGYASLRYAMSFRCIQHARGE